MSINVIHLNKLLKLMYIPDNELISELRSDIRSEIGKESGQDSGGGHFYMPFWSDVKNHVLGKIDLTEATKARIASNKNMANLYPLLEKGFLNLWKRGDNQTVTVIEKSPKGTYKTDNDLTVKVENIMAISIDGNERLGYPYWFPEPLLSDEAARVGLWVMKKALSDQDDQNMRIFDIIRSSFYSLQNSPLKGDEEEILLNNFCRISELRSKLRLEYK